MRSEGAALGAVPFEIIGSDTDAPVGTDGRTRVVLGTPGGRMFRRRSVKRVGSGEPQNVEWLVVELSGVKVYVDNDGTVVVTTADIWP